MTIASVWARLWVDITTSVEVAPRTALIPLLTVLVVLAVPSLWHLARHVVTIAHESGHSAVAMLMGRTVRGIRLHADTSGLTTSIGQERRLPLSLMAFAGYPAPGVLGLGAAALIAAGYPLALLWIVVLVLLIVLMQIRNFYGLLVLVVVIAAAVAVAWFAPTEWRVGVAYGIAWLLMLGSVRAVVELGGSRRRGRAAGSDADALARLTRVPGGVWVALFWLVTVGCFVGGAWLMVGGLVSA
ncbi:M50 family metallopeptidase [Demequina capsici]|uniref:M50 family metallopeptidase n=1 Tax=Demequina capsici TaxID=3075620 RepID=A0AA96JCH3_9MICO|nr:M50 family metallopeptidase [Demequina sp. OYTSA14]WNM23639.1 M50 family metallopeptidase [Demequina sp. OYTSA14]